MTIPNSSTGGYIAPYLPPPGPSDDDAFDAAMHDLVTGITGLPGNMVRPRWQSTPPKMPEPSVDWCAIGLIDEVPEFEPWVGHWPGEPTNPGDRTGQGFDEYQSISKMQIMASFYGPNCGRNANLLRDGFGIAQNREAMFLQNMQLVSNDCRIICSPDELINQTIWYHRADITFFIVRMSNRSYPVLNILEADGTIQTDIGLSEPFKAGPNPPDRPDYGGPQS